MVKMHNALGHKGKGWSFWKYHFKLLCCARRRQTHKLRGYKTSQPRRMTRLNLWSQALKPPWALSILYLQLSRYRLFKSTQKLSPLSLEPCSHFSPSPCQCMAILIVKSHRGFVSNLALFLSVGVSKCLRSVEEEHKNVASIKTPTSTTYALPTGPRKQYPVLKFFTLGR